MNNLSYLKSLNFNDLCAPCNLSVLKVRLNRLNIDPVSANSSLYILCDRLITVSLGMADIKGVDNGVVSRCDISRRRRFHTVSVKSPPS